MTIEPKKINFDVAIKSTNHTRSYTLPPEVYTSDDNAVQFRFNILDVTEEEFVEGAAVSTIEITTRDGSIFQKVGETGLEGTTIVYDLNENEGNHAGLAKIQLVLQLGTKKFTSDEYEFKIINNIVANKVPVEIYVQNWETLTSQAEAYITQMAQDIEDFDVALETGILATNIAAKLQSLESTYAPEIVSMKAHLADMHWNMLELGCIGDGVHDDTVIIQNVIDGAEKGDTIFFPNTSGGYRTTETIIVNKPLNVIFKGYLKIDHADIGIQFKDNSSNGSFNQDYHNTIFNEGTLRVKRVRNSIYDTSSTAINIDLVNVNCSNFFISESSGGHTGLRLLGDSYGTGFPGSTYNMITIAYIVSSVISILLETKNNGYVTQNQFYGGSLTGGLLTEDTTHVDMRNNGSSEMNENIFYGLSLEGSKKTAIKGNNAHHNRFIACRFEMPRLEMLFDFESSTYNEILTGLYVDNAMRDSKFNDNDESRKNYWTMTKVSYSDYELGSIEYFDRIFYVKPKNNMLGRYNQYNNTITKSDGKWTDVRILSSGMGSVTIYTSELNTIEGKEKIDISIHDEIYVSHSATGVGFDEIQLTNPPNYSKEFIITRENGHVDVLLSVDDSIDSLIGDTIIPQGTSNIKLYYNYRTNTVRVLSVF